MLVIRCNCCSCRFFKWTDQGYLMFCCNSALDKPGASPPSPRSRIGGEGQNER